MKCPNCNSPIQASELNSDEGHILCPRCGDYVKIKISQVEQTKGQVK